MLRLKMNPRPSSSSSSSSSSNTKKKHHLNHDLNDINHVSDYQRLDNNEEDDGNYPSEFVPSVDGSPVKSDMLRENLGAMLIQEETTYRCNDYLENGGECGCGGFVEDASNVNGSGKGDTGGSSGDSRGLARSQRDVCNHWQNVHGHKLVNESCREKMCEWSYRVIDYFNIEREVVAISMSYLDRFLAHSTPCDRGTFKLAATATLRLAVKVHSPHKLEELGLLSDLSRGEFGMDDIVDMESILMQSISLRLHPPTSFSFLCFLLALVPSDGVVPSSSKKRIEIWYFAKFFVELATCDYNFVTQRPSEIAVAAILNAMEGLGLASSSSVHSSTARNRNNVESDSCSTLCRNMAFQDYIKELLKAIGCPNDRCDIVEAQKRLWDLYKRSEERMWRKTEEGIRRHVAKLNNARAAAAANTTIIHNNSKNIVGSTPTDISNNTNVGSDGGGGVIFRKNKKSRRAQSSGNNIPVVNIHKPQPVLVRE